MGYHLLGCSRAHPDPVNQYRGLFNHRSLDSLARYTDAKVEAVIPREKAPPIGPYSEYRDIPEKVSWGEYEAHHPRFIYLFPRRIFLYTTTSISFRNRVIKYIEKNFKKPDVIHAGHIHIDGYGVLPYCKKYNIPLFVMGRGYLLNNYRGFPKIGQRMIRETLRESAGIICVSKALARKAESIANNSNKVYVVANGSNPNKFPVKNRGFIRDELNIPKEELMVLFCGGFTKRKGVIEIMDCLRKLDQLDTHFIFVGHEGSYRRELVQVINESNIGEQSQVYWKMSPLSLRRLYVAADLVLLPSYAEGRPNVIYEAMASKTAVLGTDIGGIREQVQHGETGILIPPGNKNKLKEKLEDINRGQIDLQKMGENGYSRLINKGWTWESHANKINEIHRKYL